MNKELQKYYENRFDMFASDGWRDLIEDIDAMLASSQSIDGVETLEQLHFRKGELSIIRWLKTLPSVSREIYESLENE